MKFIGFTFRHAVWFAAVALYVLAPVAGAAGYSGGSGTEVDPYQIATAADWNTLSSVTTDWDKQFVLNKDLDFAGATLTPVGNDSTEFKGVFDGAGHVLRNCDISAGNSYVGLFGNVGGGGEIRDLSMEMVSVQGLHAVGGLAGRNGGTLKSCCISGTITGDVGSLSVGGLVGFNVGGFVRSCCAAGYVGGADNVGGLVGTVEAGSVLLCYAEGTVMGNTYVGGLAGYNDMGSITSCYAEGTVTADTSLGGLIGYNEGTVSACYARGSVTGAGEGWNIGGFVGSNDGNVSSCYATGEVTGGGEDPYVGGFAGRNWLGTISSCYWDMNTTGLPTSHGGEGRSTAAMTYPYAPDTYAGWDFTTVWIEDVSGSINEGYPYLLGNNAALYSGGTGSAIDPYKIGRAADWKTLCDRADDWGKYFILIADIDFAGALLTPVGTDFFTPFRGIFDGDGYVLRNARINLPENDYAGVFGCVSGGSEIRGLGVEMVEVTGKRYVGGLAGSSNGALVSCYTTGAVAGDEEVGGLVGKNSGNITSCHATAAVIGGWYVGGLVGYNSYGVVTSCYAASAVMGTAESHFVGGLAGSNYEGMIEFCCALGEVTALDCVGGLVGISTEAGTVMSCYARSTVKGETQLGGLAGRNNGAVTSCYAVGTVTGGASAGGLIWYNNGTVALCYWDMDISGLSTSDGGEGRTTAEMTYPYGGDTYVDWNFVDVWAADVDGSTNKGYPYLLGNVPPPEEGEGEPAEGEGESEGEGEPPVPHPADLNTDFHMVLGEAIAYLSGWQQGDNPIAYAIRAAYLWQNGEQYIFDGAAVPPMCWVLAL